MLPDGARLLELAEAVADREPVDWETELESDAGLRDKLRCLKVIESIEAAHRTSSEVPTPDEWGPLKILGKIGEGGFGDVYRAHDSRLQRDVALKLRRPQPNRDDDLFLNEARRLARVRHENVLVVHGADRHDGRVGLWTDLLAGKTLEEMLTEQGTLSAEEATVVAIDMCAALAAVHTQGLVHRDVKTANIMRVEGGRNVLLDFSAVVDRSSVENRGEPLSGTPAFMALELLEGERGSPESDIYSLGVVLYRLVSGRLPITPTSIADLIDKHRRGERVPLRDARPDLPAPFVQVVERCLASKAGERYASAGELERALRGHQPVPVPVPVPPSPWPRRVLLAAAGLAVIAVGLTMALWPNPLEVEAQLYRVDGARKQALGPGSEIGPGDALFLEIQGSHAMHVYILNEDQDGRTFVLFPLSAAALKNPLPPDVAHRLPGVVNGESKDWEVDRDGGAETFLIVASRKPLPPLEKRLARIPQAGSGQAVELEDDGIMRELRGMGGLTPSEPPPGSGSVIPEVTSELPPLTAGSSGVWYWKIHLNPRRR